MKTTYSYDFHECETPETDNKPDLTPDHKRWPEAVEALAQGKTNIVRIKDRWALTDELAAQLEEEAANFKTDKP